MRYIKLVSLCFLPFLLGACGSSEEGENSRPELSPFPAYYIQEGGTAAIASAKACGNSATTMSVETHNANAGGVIQSGDTIILCDDNGTIKPTQAITPPVDNLTYDAESGHTPVISGETYINGWTATGTNSEYKVSLTTVPYSVFEDSTTVMDCVADEVPGIKWQLDSGNTYKSRLYYKPAFIYSGGVGSWTQLTEGSSKDTLSAGEWFHDGDPNYKIYIHAPGDVDLATAGDNYIFMVNNQPGDLSASSCSYDVINQELYVKTNDGSAPATNEISYATLDHIFNISDRSNITIQNLQLEKSRDSAVYAFPTGDQNGINILSNIFRYIGYDAIEFNTSQNTPVIAISDVTISGNDIRYIHTDSYYVASSKYTLAYFSGIIKFRSRGGATYNNVQVLNNYIYGTPTDTEGNAISGDRNGVNFLSCNSCLIQGNEIENVDHGMVVAGIVDMLYNNLHDITDDCLVAGGKTDICTDLKFIGNLCVNSGNNGMGTGPNTCIYAVNNTFINTYNTPMLLFDAGSVVVNNIFYVSDFSDIWGIKDYLIQVNDTSLHTIDNNIYYLATGIGDHFKSGTTEYDFTGWQGLGVDANSFTDQPDIDLTTGISGSAGPQKDSGIDQCAIFQSLLHKDAVWSVGKAPKIIDVCPVALYGNWDIGATGLNGP